MKTKSFSLKLFYLQLYVISKLGFIYFIFIVHIFEKEGSFDLKQYKNMIISTFNTIVYFV